MPARCPWGKVSVTRVSSADTKLLRSSVRKVIQDTVVKLLPFLTKVGVGESRSTDTRLRGDDEVTGDAAHQGTPSTITGTEPSRPIKEVSWPSATAALPRNTGTSITTLASKADRLRETTGDAPLGPDRRFHGVAGAACTQQRRWRLRSFRRQPEPCSDLMRAVFASTLPGIAGTAPAGWPGGISPGPPARTRRAGLTAPGAPCVLPAGQPLWWRPLVSGSMGSRWCCRGSGTGSPRRWTRR